MVEDAFGDALGACGGEAVGDDDEFVAAVSSDDVFGAGDGGEDCGDVA